MSSYYLALEVKQCHFCCFLFARSESLRLASPYSQGEELENPHGGRECFREFSLLWFIVTISMSSLFYKRKLRLAWVPKPTLSG